MKRVILIVVLLPIVATASWAQQKKLVRDGNKLYKEEKYEEAANVYKNALMQKPDYTPAAYNMGNVLYKQKNYEQAREVMARAVKMSKEENITANSYYNIGNTYMQEKKWQEAIEAYKEALRKNPQDADAKYNLSYAKEMLKKDGGDGKSDDKKDKNKNQQNKDKNSKDKQDKNDEKNKDNKDEGKDKQDQKDKQKKDEKEGEGDKEKEKQQRPQGQPSKLSKQQADQLLKALQNEEKKLQDKLKKGEGVPVKVEKDW